jgi:hypothetical protein
VANNHTIPYAKLSSGGSKFITFSDGDSFDLLIHGWEHRTHTWPGDEEATDQLHFEVIEQDGEPVEMTLTAQGVLMRALAKVAEKYDKTRIMRVTVTRTGQGKDTKYVVKDKTKSTDKKSKD